MAPTIRSSPRANIGLSMLPGVHRALARGPSAHNGVEFVDERDDLPSDSLISSNTALSRSSNSPRYLAPATIAPRSRADQFLAAQGLGHVTSDDPLGEALNDGRLTDARFTDQHRIVFGPSDSTCTTRRISVSRPITGSIFPSRANAVRSCPYFSRALKVPSGSWDVTPARSPHVGQRAEQGRPPLRPPSDSAAVTSEPPPARGRSRRAPSRLLVAPVGRDLLAFCSTVKDWRDSSGVATAPPDALGER